MSYYYNIHNLLRVRSDIGLSLKNHIYPFFDCFRVTQLEPNFIIELGNEDIKDCIELSKGLYRKDDCIISKLGFGKVSFIWSIKGLYKTVTVLRINCLYAWSSKWWLRVPISAVYPIQLLIRNIMQIKLLQQNSTWVIGAGLKYKGQSIIISGGIGIGKTTALRQLMDFTNVNRDFTNVNFLSSNIMIGKDKTLYGFPTSLSLRTFDVGPISFRQYINPSEIYEVIDEMSKPFTIFILERNKKDSIKRMNTIDGINSLYLTNNRVHSYTHERLLSWHIIPEDKEYRLLLNLFINSKFYKVRSPEPKNFGKLIKEVL